MDVSESTGDIVLLKGGASVSEKGTAEHITQVLSSGFLGLCFPEGTGKTQLLQGKNSQKWEFSAPA